MKRWVCIVAVLLAGACTTPRMQVDEQLSAEAIVMPVKGRQGWLINQHLSFGPFMSSKVDRGWTKSYDIPFIIHFSGSKEKLSFSLGREGLIADIFCLGKLREQDLPLFDRLFEVNIKTKDTFTGTVVIDGESPYNFFVSNLNRNNNFYDAEGQIVNESAGVKIQLRSVRTLEGGQSSWAERALGFEFVRDGKVIGGVETLNQGKIWLHNSLTNHDQLVIASVAAALLLRSDLDPEVNL